MANIIYRNQANKIFIYNSANEEVNNDEHIEPNNTSSITILTSGIPEYHIRIKNSYKTEAAVKNSINDFENATDPKSNSARLQNMEKDTKPLKMSALFSLNEDVLLRSLDDKLYLGTIVSIKDGKYLVKFDDNTEKWSREQGLKKLDSSINRKTENDDDDDNDDPLCVICKEKSETDVVEVCNKCCRGYHRDCIKKPESSNFSSPWCCDRCTASEVISISDSEDNENEDVVVETSKLPYDLESLTWDLHHRENKEQIYCYCGEKGSWREHMLQCCQCQQWFHKKCIDSWKGYMIQGDTFFVFSCHVCNDGTEFLHRLNIDWKIAVHLVLFELTMLNCTKKDFSVSKDVAPFIWEKWEYLNLPFIKYQSNEKLVKKVSQTVKRENEFKLVGGSNKQKGDFVCLRRKTPPVAPKLNIPRNNSVNEKTLKQFNIKTTTLNQALDSLKQQSMPPSELVPAMKVEAVLQPKEKRRKRGHQQARNSSIENQSDVVVHQNQVNDDSSDENSSKSALDWIIPVPSNFHGKNNPFHSQYETSTKRKVSDKVRKGQQSNFEKLPEVRIVRTIKRRLSARDIAIGSNRDTKRRKNMKRRKSSDIQIISEVIQSVNTPLPSCIPLWNGDSTKYTSAKVKVEQVFSEQSDELKFSRTQKQSRTRSLESFMPAEDVEAPKISLTDAVINSPVKNKSINMYFGASNRIEHGEKFTILAKRLTFDKKEQYLLEWDALNSNAAAAACSVVVQDKPKNGL